MADEHLARSAPIDAFFVRCGLDPRVRLDCHAFLESLFPGRSIAPAQMQGYCSYTVLVNGRVVQFRPSNYKLDMSVTAAAKDVYTSFAPATTYLATLSPSGLLVYIMDKMQGVSYKDFRMNEHPQASKVRQTLCEDFALFLARSWHHRGKVCLTARTIGSSIFPRLERLSKELPSRFWPTANRILSQLDLVKTLPLVLVHGDIVPSNIMLEPSTGHLFGLVDWAEAEYLPFGICLYGLEEILGYMTNDCFVYHTDAEQARGAFWTTLYQEIPELAEERTLKAVHVARDLGILLWHGFAFDDGAINRVVQEDRDLEEICYLDALLAHDKFIS